MWELDYKESWAPKDDAFELWCWRRLLRVPWTARRSNQSILKEISPGCSLKGPMLKLKSNTLMYWCEELTHLKRPWCWERLREGGEGDDRGWDGWMASPTQWTWVWVSSRSWWWTGRPGVLWFMGSQSRVRLSRWTKLMSNAELKSSERQRSLVLTFMGLQPRTTPGWSQQGLKQGFSTSALLTRKRDKWSLGMFQCHLVYSLYWGHE